MIWLLVGYMWLYIHRPFEIWEWLATIRLERMYMIAMCAYAVVFGKLRWRPSLIGFAFGAFFVSLYFCWTQSIYPDEGSSVVENYLKMLVFFFLMVNCVHDERNLRRLIWGFLIVTALYMSHSLWEYFNGRHEWRMGIRRMIGVDSTRNNPNSFAATIVYSLPLIVPGWHTAEKPRQRWFLVGYLILSITCILLTGSRTAFAALAFLGLIYVAIFVKRRIRALFLIAAASLVVFAVLPADLQNRYLTIINPEFGPENAQESAQSRIDYLVMSLNLWRDRPLFGVGPGAFDVASGTGMQSHNLLAQIISEMGTLGLVSFLLILFALISTYLSVARDMRSAESDSGFLRCLLQSVLVAVLLLLFVGIAAHNLYRYNWLWFGAILVCAARVVQDRAFLNDEEVGELPGSLSAD